MVSEKVESAMALSEVLLGSATAYLVVASAALLEATPSSARRHASGRVLADLVSTDGVERSER